MVLCNGKVCDPGNILKLLSKKKLTKVHISSPYTWSFIRIFKDFYNNPVLFRYKFLKNRKIFIDYQKFDNNG